MKTGIRARSPTPPYIWRNGHETEDHPAGKTRGLTVFLQMRDFVNGRGMHPGLNCSPSVQGGDDVGRGLLDHAESVDFQMPDDDILPRLARQ